MGFYQEALQSYMEFLKYKPDYENAHSSLGLAYHALGKQDKAIQSFEEELKYHPDHVYAHLYLGNLFTEMKEYPKALAHFETIRNDPRLPESQGVHEKISSIERTLKQGQGRLN
jgi:tetratricopeptide (TPR) repeat protein